MKYILLTATLMLSLSMMAQNEGDRSKRGEKIEQQRIAFITSELDLSVEEAQNFWPIYNDYQKRKKELEADRKSVRPSDDLTEQEASNLLSQVLEAKKRNVELELEFMDKLERTLPATKRLKLVRSERKFKQSVLSRYKKRMKRGEKMKEKAEKKEKRKNERFEEK